MTSKRKGYCHYTGLKGVEGIIKNGEIILSSLNKTNDILILLYFQ